MNGFFNIFGLVGGVAVAVISAVSAYRYKGQYEGLVNDIYKPGNQELREQITSARQQVADLVIEKSTLQAEGKQKDERIKDLKELNSNLPDYTALTEKTNQVVTLMSNNHKSIMNQLTKLATAITGKVDGKDR